MHIPTHPWKSEDPILGSCPVLWWGTDDRDGDAEPWLNVPPGSIYIYMNSTVPKLYIKDANAGADADWAVIDQTT